MDFNHFFSQLTLGLIMLLFIKTKIGLYSNDNEKKDRFDFDYQQQKKTTKRNSLK